jgi:uncharacterized protein (DUF2384 family)
MTRAMTRAMQTNPRPKSAASDSAIVTKAALRAAVKLRVTNKVLARVIGVSEATVSRMGKGAFPLETDTKPFELAVLFIRLYRSLDAIAGGDESVAGAWLSNPNLALDGRPFDLIQSVSGLTNVIQYLDARRALV